MYKIVAVRTLQVSVLAGPAHWLLHWPLTGPSALGLFLTPALCLYFVFVFVGTLTWGLPILTRLPGKPNAVALTFDDGPSPETTPRILDILHSEGVSATFFILGEAAERHPELLRRIVTDGHAVGIHSYRHEPFVLMSAPAIHREVACTEAAVRKACPDAVIVPWVRPPHGFKSLSLVWVLRRAGYGMAGWSVDSRDYQEHNPGRITDCVARKMSAGSISLLHDGSENTATAEALLPLIRKLKERGLTFATL